MRKLKIISFYTFTCPVCDKTLTVDKPFNLEYCPFCGLCLADYRERRVRLDRYDRSHWADAPSPVIEECEVN